jgi:hypothetical protein
MSNTLAEAVVRIGADIRDFDAGLALVKEEMDKTGKEMEAIGKSLSLKITLPLVAAATLAVKEFGAQEDAIAKVNAVIAATGGVAGVTAEHVIALGDSIQQLTRFDDDAVVSAAGLLLTFQRVRNEMGAGNDVFDRAIHSAADLAAVMGTDLSTATFQLGRALEDPATGLTMLRRAGIQFTQAEQAQIKILVDHNQLLQAQQIILGRVEGKTRDAAVAMAATPLGQFTQAWNALKDAIKPVGAILVEVLVPLAHLVKDAADAFKNLSPEVLRVVVIMGTAAAAIGPLLVTLATLRKLWVGVTAAIGLGLTPVIALVVVAIGSLVAAGIALTENWAWVKLQAFSLWVAIKDAFFTGIEFILDKVAQLGSLLEKIPAVARAMIPGFGTVSDIMIKLGHAAGDMRDDVAGAHEEMLASAAGTLSKLEADYQAVIDRLAATGKQAGKTADQVHSGNDALEAALIAANEQLRAATQAAIAMGAILGPTFNVAGAQAEALMTHLRAVADAMSKAGVPAGEIARALAKEGAAWRAANLAAGLRDAVIAFDDATQAAQVMAKVLGPSFNPAQAEAEALRARIDAVVQVMMQARRSTEEITAAVAQLGAQWQAADLNAHLHDANREFENATKNARVLGAIFGQAFDVAGAEADALRAQIEAIVTAMVAAGKSQEEIIAKVGDLGRQLQDLEDKAKLGDFFRDQFGQATDALVDFATGSKEAFADFVRQALIDLAKLILRIEAMRLLTSLLGGLGGGGGGGGGPSLTPFASGGFVDPGSFALVGERGPEILRAGRAGVTVAPVSAVHAGEGGGGTAVAVGDHVSVPITIMANDGPSVQRFFEMNEGLMVTSIMRAFQKSRALRSRLAGGVPS